MTKDEYAARWGKATQWPETDAQAEEWLRDIQAVKADSEDEREGSIPS